MQVCHHWYPVVCDLHRFFIAIARVLVDDDGLDDSAPDPLVWGAGSLPKRRRPVEAVWEYAVLLGPEALSSGGGQDWPENSVTADDVRV